MTLAVPSAPSRITTAAKVHLSLDLGVPVAYFLVPAAARNTGSSLSGAPIARCSRPISARISSTFLSAVIDPSSPCLRSPHAAHQPVALSLGEAWSARSLPAPRARSRPVRSSTPRARTGSPLRAELLQFIHSGPHRRNG